jgi:GH15 family glucan-1,4-alpha-glucosidase
VSMDSEAPRAGLAPLVRHSLDLIDRFQAPSGAYPAAPSFSAYRGYSWLRDGAFIAEGVSRHGRRAGPDAFHAWCARVVGERTDQVDALIARAARGETITPAEMLPTRFTLDGAEGAEEWWDFQLDGYGTWLWSLAGHAARYGTLPPPGAAKAARTAARYLTAFWATPCYDWWEEHLDRRHVSTLGAIHAGLLAAVSLEVLTGEERAAAESAATALRALVAAEGVVDGHLVKWLGGEAVDGSLLACAEPFRLLPAGHPVTEATVARVTADLTVAGGVHRYLTDTFYGGGRWVLLTGLLGWNHARAGRTAEALRCLEWMAARATPEGDLPEQVSDVLLAPARRAEWEDRWGPVATPLLWSHGMYLILADELGVRG